MLTDEAKAREHEMINLLPGGHDAVKGLTARQAFIARYGRHRPPESRADLESLNVDGDSAVVVVRQLPRRSEWRLVRVGSQWQIKEFGVPGLLAEDRPGR